MQTEPRTINTVDNPGYTELLPPEGSPELGYRIFEILGEVLEDKSNLKLPEKWKRNYELVKNKHWRSSVKNSSLVSANLIFTHRERTTNLLTDNNPTFNVAKTGRQQEEEGGENVYEAINRTADHWWREQEQQDVLETSVRNGEMNGCAVEKVLFNPDLEYGMGEVETVDVDPHHFGVYPVNVKYNQKAEANLHYYPMSVREAKRKWPELASSIVADSDYLDELGSDRRQISGTSGAGEPSGYLATFTGVIKKMLGSNKAGTAVNSDDLLVVECWVKDYSTVEEEQVVEDAGPVDDLGRPAPGKQTVTTPKYRGYIRCVTVLNGGRLVVSDKSNPSINHDLPVEEAMKAYLFDKFPFIWVPSIKDPVNGWGMCDIEQLEVLQREIDKALSQFTTFKDKVARLKIINPKDSGVKDQEFTNAAGIIHPASSFVAKAIGYMKPPPIPGELITALELYKDFFFLVAGTFDLDMAKSGGRDVLAYKAIAALIERASTMAKGKIRNYNRLIRERGRMAHSLMANYYTEDRWISFEKDGQQQTQKINGAMLLTPARINVVIGSTLPVSLVQKREESITLFEKGAIDRIELLKSLDWENYMEVNQRMDAGPIGQFLDKMGAIGVPPQALQELAKLMELEVKEIPRALEKGEVVSFKQMLQVLMQQLGAQGPAQAGPEQMAAQADAGKVQAETQKIMAEADRIRTETAKTMEEIRETQANIQLLMEKAKTEEILRIVKAAGVDLDEQQMEVVRAQAVSDIKVKEASVGNDKGGKQGPYVESGMKSNNQE